MERVIHSANPQALISEIERLRGEVERLEAKVVELDKVAHTDALAPVANRRGLYRQLELLIAHRQRHGTSGALLFVDVDGLKELNDTHGHVAGDAAICRIASLMVSGVRQTDMVARLGGDEFAILLDHVDERAAHETAARLVSQVADCKFEHEGTELPLSIAIGVTMIADGDDAEDVLDRADRAMYRRKAEADATQSARKEPANVA